MIGKSKTDSNILEVLKSVENTEPFRLFNLYVSNLVVGKPVSSPFRTDKNPSFTLFYARNNNTYMYIDKATGESGGALNFAIKYLQKTYGYATNKAIQKIYSDLNLEKVPAISLKSHPSPIVKKASKPFIPVKRPLNANDLEYWSDYEIYLDTLELFSTTGVSEIRYGNGFVIRYIENSNTYLYSEYKDGQWFYKIYRPLAQDPKNKWKSTCNDSIHFGYRCLPYKGDILVITKSMKDVMVLHTMGIPSISPQGETVRIKQKVMDEYLFRFKNIFLLYDNDFAGKTFAKDMVETYPKIVDLWLPKEGNLKDISDYTKEESRAVAQQRIHHLLGI
jgi:hypothetical protein